MSSCLQIQEIADTSGIELVSTGKFVIDYYKVNVETTYIAGSLSITELIK